MTQDDDHARTGRSAEAFITERELASRWKVSARTLQRWRAESYGPAWTTIGGSIRYQLAVIRAYEASMHRGGR